MADIEIEIDGKKLSAKPSDMVIQVADAAGIYIPRFCYHKLLTVAANCRMCLVEVEKSPKTLPACATPVMAGMKVFTRSAKALAAQKAVMEFLLINHPLDCPICDQGGECELQDLAMGFGSPDSFYHEGKRSVKDQDIGPLIQTDMTRCIQCTRCVRFGAEIAGMPELGAVGRGEDMEISTYVEHAMKSEVSGNVIDICPVGALTSKPFRFTARAWELEQRPTISAHDCMGSNLYAHTRDGVVMRMVPRENTKINQTWISDRDRFSYEALYHPDRITRPLMKRHGQWQEVDWETGLAETAMNLQKIASDNGGPALGALASPNATLEEFYLLQKVMRGLGSSNIDHRLRQTDFTDQDNFAAAPALGMQFAELEECDTILLIGANLQKEVPAANLRIRQAALRGAKVLAVNPLDFAVNFPLTEKYIVTPSETLLALAGIAKELQAESKVATDEQQKTFARYLREGKKVCVLLGNLAMNYQEAAQVRALALEIANHCQGVFGMLTEGANAAGAWLAGAVPHRGPMAQAVTPGMNVSQMLAEPRHAYVLLNVEPDLDCAHALAAAASLQQAEFVVSLSLFRNPLIDQHAHVILPIAPFTETAGTFVNAAGDWQRFNGVASAFAESRPAWKVLRVLGNLLHLEGFDYTSNDEVHHELKNMLQELPELKTSAVTLDKEKLITGSGLTRIGFIPLYAVDSLTRRAAALQMAQPILEGEFANVHVNPKTAAELRIQNAELVTIKQKNGQARLLVKLDARVPERGLMIAGGIVETTELAELFGPVEVVKG
ncbi:MAG: NADH-quinone oxidoreductase subunit NuoG [Pseudomonadota bacterium]